MCILASLTSLLSQSAALIFTTVSPQQQVALNRRLLNAIACKNSHAIITALEQGADVDAQAILDRDDLTTTLMYATIMMDFPTVQTLIAAGANLDLQGDIGHTSLILAAIKGDVQITRALLDAGADINSRVTLNPHSTALDYALHYQYSEIIDALLAETDKRDKERATLLIQRTLKHTKLAYSYLKNGPLPISPLANIFIEYATNPEDPSVLPDPAVVRRKKYEAEQRETRTQRIAAKYATK